METHQDSDTSVHASNSQVWVVMPALNEGPNLRWLLPTIPKEYQVVVVDNGSTDNTASVAVEEGAIVVTCRQRGYGIAMLTGVKKIAELGAKDEDTIIFFDSDGTSPSSQMGKLVEGLKKGADLVIGQRLVINEGAMPSHAVFGNKLQVFLIRKLTGTRYEDMGPMRAMSFGAFKKLEMQDQSWAWNVEMQVKAALLGMKLKEHSIMYGARRFGNSKISGSLFVSIRAGFKIIYGVFYYYLAAQKLRNRYLSLVES